jgi:hypothetical protein
LKIEEAKKKKEEEEEERRTTTTTHDDAEIFPLLFVLKNWLDGGIQTSQDDCVLI